MNGSNQETPESPAGNIQSTTQAPVLPLGATNRRSAAVNSDGCSRSRSVRMGYRVGRCLRAVATEPAVDVASFKPFAGPLDAITPAIGKFSRGDREDHVGVLKTFHRRTNFGLRRKHATDLTRVAKRVGDLPKIRLREKQRSVMRMPVLRSPR